MYTTMYYYYVQKLGEMIKTELPVPNIRGLPPDFSRESYVEKLLSTHKYYCARIYILEL